MGDTHPQKRHVLVAFAPAWGARNGGVNVFNTDLLKAIRLACNEQLLVICFVPRATENDIASARSDGILLFEVGVPILSVYEFANKALKEASGRAVLRPDDEILWLGHDRLTGPHALEARDVYSRGRVAVIHHMSYAHYEAYAENISTADRKELEQREIFERSDILMAVGPLLRDALSDLVPGREIAMIIPSLPEITAAPTPRTFTAFVSGRLSADASKVKQGYLAVAAFSEAVKRAHGEPGLPENLRRQPKLVLRGVPDDGEPEGDSLITAAKDWSNFAEATADRVVNIHPLPHTESRDDLFRELASATVALMPSWHEGFGIAGWEAIGAGIPLIVTIQSGLYRLLDEMSHGAWLAWVYPVDVRGSSQAPYYRAEDASKVAGRILEVAADPRAARGKAASLREELKGRFTAVQAAETALEAWGWQSLRKSLAIKDFGDEQFNKPEERPATVVPPLLDLPEPRWTAGGGLADSQLLRAEEEAVPFDQARQPDLEDIRAWCESSEYRNSLKLVTGRGGTGKTRLAIELSRLLLKNSWVAGFIAAETFTRSGSAVWNRILSQDRNVFAVIDYAETRQAEVLSAVRTLLEADGTRENPIVRILLLARDAGTWWETLPSIDGKCEAFFNGPATSGPHSLKALHREHEDRERAFQTAIQAYASRMRINAPTSLSVDLSGDHFAHPLFLQMAALLALYGQGASSAEGLTKALINHERRYWKRTLGTAGGGKAGSVASELPASELMALVTLAGGVAHAEESALLWRSWRHSQGAQASNRARKQVFESLVGLYPDQKGLEPLRPDILGEALAAEAILQKSGGALIDVLLGMRATRARRRSALTMIARLSRYRTDLEGVVVAGMVRNLEYCASEFADVATQSESRLPEWTESAFGLLTQRVQQSVVKTLLPRVVHNSVELASLACSLSRVDVALWQEKLARKPHDVGLKQEYVKALTNRAVDLTRAGRDAMDTYRLSVEIAGQLAGADEQRFGADYAFALSNYANELSRSAREQEALPLAMEAVEIRERLAATGAAQSEEDVAAALVIAATQLHLNAQYDEALEAAEKALRIRERLATANREAFLPSLATSELILGQMVRANGQLARGAAGTARALAIKQELSTNNGDRFLPELAEALMVHARSLGEVGEYAESLRMAREGLAIAERLAAKNASRFNTDLAEAKSAFAGLLINNAEYEVARNVLEDAMRISLEVEALMPGRLGGDIQLQLLAARWLAWRTGTPLPEVMVRLQAADKDQLPAHLRTLWTGYSEWVGACEARDRETRGRGFNQILTLARTCHPTEKVQIYPYWLAASAWVEKYGNMEIASENVGWRGVWKAFASERGGHLPPVMEDMAVELGIEWPTEH